MMRVWFWVVLVSIVPQYLFGVDGQILINQPAVLAAGGFPYIISSPGSYKLSGNLSLTSSADAIQIKSDNVALDLNGFTITGPVTCSGNPPACSENLLTAGSGIVTPQQQQNVSVRNGGVRGFQTGIFLNAAGASVMDVQASGNQLGIQVAGPGAIVVRCTALSNSQDGFFTLYATVSESTASTNGRDGFHIVSSTLLHNVAAFNHAGIDNSSKTPSSVFGSNVLYQNNFDTIGPGSQNNNGCTFATC